MREIARQLKNNSFMDVTECGTARLKQQQENATTPSLFLNTSAPGLLVSPGIAKTSL
jgi:hypothetical protein